MNNVTVGSGGDYTNWAAVKTALLAAHPLADDWTVNQISNTTDTFINPTQLKYGGKTVTFQCTNNETNDDDHTKWYTSTFTAAAPTAYAMDMQGDTIAGSGGGNFVCKYLYFIQTTINNSAVLLRLGGGVNYAIISTISNCLFKGSGYTGGSGLTHYNNSDYVRIYNCKFWNLDYGIDLEINNLQTFSGPCRVFVENCTIYNCDEGVYIGETAAATQQVFANIKNVVSCGCNTNDWVDTGSGTYYQRLFNCADSDGSLDSLDSDILQYNSISNIVAADEFISTDDTSSDFLKLKPIVLYK